MNTPCPCEPCRKRRENRRKWLDAVPGRRAHQQSKSNEARKKHRKPPAVSDEELDRRALQSLEEMA
jgi:hypothetical protein